ncbi:MAG: type I CRISPR-associated protein Cas8a1/Csx8 [Terrisporobacter sp.]
MKSSIENSIYDTKIEASDWRFSAAILGLIKYLRHHNFEYEVTDEYLLYNSQDICEEKYLEFVEFNYGSDLHHKIVEDILLSDDISDEQVKLVNEKLVANTIMKKTFNKIKFDGSNKEAILSIVSKNRNELTRETFGKKSNLYANYISVNMKAPIDLFKESQEYCRLLGYTIDVGKKGKSTGYNFNTSTFVGADIPEFDFIPFSFVGDRESFFINDNIKLKRLMNSNDMLEKKVDLERDENKKLDVRRSLFKGIIESSDFIDYDVEVIFKDRDKGYFETLYLRKESIDILKGIKDYKSFCFSHKVTEKYYINIQKKVTDSILNNILVDELIELFLKEKSKSYLVKQLININVLIRGDKDMNNRLKGAYACAKQVAKVLPQNKIDSYKQKLTSSIIFKDYDRVCQILLQLSNYSNIEFGFVYDLYENFEDNKDLAYTFINALSKGEENKINENN